MADAATASRPSPIRRVFSLFWADRSDVLSVVVFSLLNGALLLATPAAVQALVNYVAFGATAPSIAILAGLLFLGLLMGAVVLAVQTWVVEIIQRRVFVRLVSELTERLRRLRWDVRDRYYNPELVNRFFDVVTIQKAGSELLLAGLGNVLSVAVGLVVIAFYHPLLLFMGLAIFGFILLVFLGPLGAGMRSSIRESEAKYEVAAWLEEITRHPLTFRASGSEVYVRERSRELASSYIDARRKHYRVVFAQISAALGLQVLASTAILGLGGWLVVSGELTLGQLVAAELIIVVIVQSVAKLGKHAETWYDLVAAADKVGKLVDLEVEDESDVELLPRSADGPAALQLRNLALCMPGHPSPQRISVRVPAGGSLAITGPTGAGKTLLLETIFRLRRCEGGTLVLDGRNGVDIPLSEYRSQIAFASTPDLLEASILDNLVLGREGITAAEIDEVLAAVGLLERIRDLPDGASTRLLPTGAPLSSGQASRLVLARALLGRPRLLLVDGILDDFSRENRQALMHSLSTRPDGLTLVVVTNSDDVAERCDQTVELGWSQEVSS